MLTSLNRRVLCAIYDYERRYSAYASIGDIARKFHRSHPTIHEHFRRLTDHGLIELVKRGGESGWRITTKGYQELGKSRLVFKSIAPPRHVRLNRGKMAQRTKERIRAARITAAILDAQLDPYTGLAIYEG